MSIIMYHSYFNIKVLCVWIKKALIFPNDIFVILISVHVQIHYGPLWQFISIDCSCNFCYTVLANWDFTLVHKYYINRVSLSQDYIPTFKVPLCCFSVKCKQIWLRAFKWATIHHNGSRGCKTVTCQSRRSEKIAFLTSSLLSKMGFVSVWGYIFFGHPTVKGHSFAYPESNDDE